MNRTPMHGIVPPLVTPLDDQRQLDLAGLERLVDRLVDGGVQGLFVLGTTGEGPSLTQAVQQQVVSAVCDQVAGRLPVFVGITNTVVAHSMEIAEAAFAAGAEMLVLAPPYYLPLTQTELLRYTEDLVDRLPLPVMLYNMPSCCKVWFDVDTVAQLSQISNVAGLKDSSGDLDYLRGVIESVTARPDFSLFVGPEEILVEAIQCGAHGGVHGGANMFPGLYVELYRQAAAGNWDQAEHLQRIVHAISTTIYAASEGPSRIIKGIKSVLRLQGICGDQLALPCSAHSDAARETVRQHLEDLHEKLSEFAPQMPSSRPTRS